jgi:hypothetical protein
VSQDRLCSLEMVSLFMCVSVMSDSKKVFLLQKKIVRNVMNVKSCNSYRDLFKRLQLLTLPCKYIYIH